MAQNGVWKCMLCITERETVYSGSSLGECFFKLLFKSQHSYEKTPHVYTTHTHHRR